MVYATPGENNNNRWEGTPAPSISDMFHALPFVTRCWFGASLIVTFSVNFSIISMYQVTWMWEGVTSRLEIWRFLAPFCYAGGKTINTLFTLYMLLMFSKQYELGVPFNTGAGGGTADYAFCLLLGCTGMLLTYPLVMEYLYPLFCDNLIYYVMYIWSKKNPNSQSNIWGFPVQGVHLPFVYLALKVCFGGNVYGMLHGIVLGHLYYFAVDVVPQVYGRDFLHTPEFLINYFGVGDYQGRPAPTPAPNRTGGFGTAGTADTSSSNRGARGRGHDWGSGGNRLGTN